MNKAELVSTVSEKRNISKAEAEILIDTMFETMKKAIMEGEKVLITGFGTFSVAEHKEKVLFNPGKKERITISQRRNIHFKPSRKLKDKLNSASK